MMKEHEYLITDDFQVKNTRVLGLDRDFNSFKFKKAMIDGELFDYLINSVKSWILIKSHNSFKGKKVNFVNEDEISSAAG